MKRFLGRTVALAMLTFAISLTMLIAIVLIAIQLIGTQPVIDGLSCHLGLSADCIRRELEEKQRQLLSLEERHAELQQLYDRLAKLEYASESFVVFYENTDGPHEVTTGHRYASLIEPGQFLTGWCYIDRPKDHGVSRNVFIADISADGEVTNTDITDDALASAGLTRREVEAALRRCIWPELRP